MGAKPYLQLFICMFGGDPFAGRVACASFVGAVAVPVE